jgi:hypothetical protein
MSSSAFLILESGFRKREARSSVCRAAVGRARVAVDLGSSICALRRQAAVAAVAIASRLAWRLRLLNRQLAVQVCLFGGHFVHVFLDRMSTRRAATRARHGRAAAIAAGLSGCLRRRRSLVVAKVE